MGTRRKYTEEILAAAVRESTSIAGVLRHLGLRPTGGAHAHINFAGRSRGKFSGHATAVRTGRLGS